MSYANKRTPCQKYYDKTNKDGLHKSLSATRFVPFRRSSDTTSDSGSDDFKLIEPAEELSSSFSRSSSESCNSYGATYHCILKDLNERKELKERIDRKELDLMQNESLQDFRSRLNWRRKVKTRTLDDDDRTDNSCDSATTKAHEEILLSAYLLKQEQAGETTRLHERKDDFANKKTHHKELKCTSSSSFFGKRLVDPEMDLCDARSCAQEESILMNEFDILQIGKNEHGDGHKSVYKQGPSTAITRSSTEGTFLSKSNSAKSHKSAVSSPRFRPKTHSQSVLKAASSIPSLIFSNNKSHKLQKSPNNISNYEQTSENSKLISSSTRLSPLRNFLGNLVEDSAGKLFRGRWSSNRRAKSTDEITWALANEDLVSSGDVHQLKDSGRIRKKSLGLIGTSSKKNSSAAQKMIDLKQRKSSGSSVASSGFNDSHFSGNAYPSAETMAEIEAFETLLMNHLQS